MTRVPGILRSGVPRAVLDDLPVRLMEREISADQLGLFAQWLNGEPEVSPGPLFKRFTGMIVCGEGELVKTFLRIGQVPSGEEVS